MAKKSVIKYACETCGHVPEKDKEKSNENWSVIPTKCPKCGGRVTLQLS